eukprot:755341-Hanusia_phi.AAC.1
MRGGEVLSWLGWVLQNCDPKPVQITLIWVVGVLFGGVNIVDSSGVGLRRMCGNRLLRKEEMSRADWITGGHRRGEEKGREWKGREGKGRERKGQEGSEGKVKKGAGKETRRDNMRRDEASISSQID